MRWFLAIVAGVTMIACEKGTEGGIPESGWNNESETGEGNDEPLKKYVKSIIEGFNGDYGYYETEYILTYDSSNRIAGMTAIEDGDIEKWEFSYGLSKVICSYDGDPTVYTFSEGKLVETNWGNGSIVFSYRNGSEHPYQCHSSSSWGEEVNYLTWSPEGNLVKCEREHEYYEDYDVITYTGHKNICNVDIISFIIYSVHISGFDFWNSDIMDASIFKSIVSNYLPAKIEDPDGDGYLFAYKFDNDGYPIEIELTDPDDNEWFVTYKISY